MRKNQLFLFVLLSLFSISSMANVVEYTLNIRNETVTKAGVPVDFALTVNGGIPAPTLRFQEGDEAVINIINHTNERTSVHWHGIILPWDQDGVPFINTLPVEPGKTFTFKFPIKQSGTYWYHSHSGLQEQRGVYGSIVIEPKEKTIEVDHDEVVILSDWINTHPMKVLANIKKGEYYSWKKDAVPNWLGALKEGAIKEYFKLRWNRMDGMDFGDIGYDAFLINGKQKSRMLENLRPGDKVRLRVINAGASTYFNLRLGKQRVKVISTDGIDVQPVEIDKMLIGMGETYDLLFTVPEDKTYEFKATAQDGSGSASILIGGSDELEKAPMMMKPSLYKMSMDGMDMGSGGMDDMDENDMGGMNTHSKPMGDMDMGDDPMPMPKKEIKLKYSMLKSIKPTNFPADTPVMEFKMSLDGDMERYTWYLNGKLLSEDTYIDIKEGHVIRFILENKTMMHHPMHLHGHFFRILFGNGNYSPLKHTVDVAPKGMMGSTVTMEFLADQPGQWFFHCHNLYHLKAGMGRVVRYIDFERPVISKVNKTEVDYDIDAEINKIVQGDQKFYPASDISVTTPGIDYNIRLNGGRYEVEFEGEVDEFKLKEIEGQVYLKHYLSRFGSVLIGSEYSSDGLTPLIGASYRVPLDFELVGYITTDKKVVFDVVKRIQLTKSLAIEGDVRWSSEDQFGYGAKAQYRINQRMSFEVNYKKDVKNDNVFGIGINFKF